MTSSKAEFTGRPEDDIENLGETTYQEVKAVTTVLTGSSSNVSSTKRWISDVGSYQPRWPTIRLYGRTMISTVQRYVRTVTRTLGLNTTESDEYCPRPCTVVANILGFLPFLGLGCAASRFPSYPMLIGSGIACSVMFLGLALMTIVDINRKGEK